MATGVEVTPKEKELRTVANLEFKYSDSHPPGHISMQLQANMLRCTAHEYAHHLTRSPAYSEVPPDIVTCYGSTFGVKTNIMLLKLTVDFKNKKHFFETRMNVPALQIPYNVQQMMGEVDWTLL